MASSHVPGSSATQHVSVSPGTTASSPKAGHYRTSLEAALLKGNWTDGSAGKAPNGTDLSWSELIRKWGKHTGGDVSLLHHLRNISILYAAPTSHPSSSKTYFTLHPHDSSSSSERFNQHGLPASAVPGPSEGESHSTGARSSLHIPHPHLRRSKSHTEIKETEDESSPLAITTSNTFAVPDTSRGDDDGPEEEAWSSGPSWWTGASLDKTEEIEKGIKEIEAIISSGKLSAEQLQIARTVLAQHLSAIGRHEEVLSRLESAGNHPNASEDSISLLSRIRAACLRGIALELSPSADDEAAITAYTSTIGLLARSQLSVPVPAYMTSSSKSPASAPFDSRLELYRWLSTSLSRASILAARQPHTTSRLLPILRTYHAYADSWGSSFRPIQRQRMILLYLRALYAGYPPAGVPCTSPYLLDGSIPVPTADARTTWRSEVMEALRQARQLLAATTTFPRAGSINHPVAAFVDLVAALADKCPLLSRDAISVMWWAMSYTFQSLSVLRHLTRLLAAVGDSEDSRRTFELYVKLVLKDRETHQPEVTLQLKRRPTEDEAAPTAVIQQDAARAEQAKEESDGKGPSQQAEAQSESDQDFVGCLLVGARLLLRNLGDAEEAWRYVCLAGDVIRNASQGGETWLSPRIRGEVEECKGIIRMAMGMRAGDPVTRPSYQAQALNHLSLATELDKTSATAFYHLSYCQAEARSIDAATDSIRRALELESKNIQSWHLLSLLLTAQGDWEAAAKAGEAGVSVWEQEEEREMRESEGSGVGGNPDGQNPTVDAKDFAVIDGQSAPVISASTIGIASNNEPLLLPSGEFKPTRVMTAPNYPPSVTRVVRLEQVIRLRMTLNVIAEKLHGPELAMLKQQELFSFFSARSGKNRGQAGGISKVLPSSMSSMSFGAPATHAEGKPVEESFVDLTLDADHAEAGRMEIETVAVQPPTPVVSQSVPLFPESHPPSGSTAPESARRSLESPGESSPITSDTDSPRSSTPGSVQPPRGPRRRSFTGGRSLSGTKRLVAKHLHVPQSRSRPSSVRRPSDKQDQLSLNRSRTASSSSAALSIAPTAVHSHFRQSAGNARLPPPPPIIQTPDHGRTPAESRILSNLWLMSAATFRRWGKLEQSLVSIEEAEVLDPENHLVWVQLGLYYCALPVPEHEAALPAFTKAILLKPDHPPGIVALAKLYLSTGSIDLAHGLLNQVTQDFGWDSADAWFYLGKCCEMQERHERAREFWTFALGLEETRPARRWSDSVDRWL
ncbi:hypothetical protein BD324DRAFT_634724 [Kockovaella imperatae]|uniref:Tetratricopeptide repeat-domain-containing protein n=1 Tax=Kockovaella imperatae TaxID=4999 RepID=A0A1Y1U9M0_9TREE|nr:hypothetical protein BD324DRAFT_634724 [Kockovaella imperatae]ORX34731.1 hypothetical protein BD324DRAFT_634724 [Kockovaella imperatae]